jgi:hypothetical protein
MALPPPRLEQVVLALDDPRHYIPAEAKRNGLRREPLGRFIEAPARLGPTR